jgi:nitrogenase molybdenum-iron protein beta chain
MKKMEQKLKIPFLHYPTLPIGAFETSKFLRTVGEYAGVPKEKVEAIIEEQEAYYYYYIERYADLFLETRVMSKQFTVVSDAHYALGITKFLVNDLGLFPAKQFVVDDTPREYREAVSSYFKDLNYGIEADVSFETDGFKIHNEIKAHDYHGYPLILGGYWEKEVAKQTNGHFLNVSWPVNERLIMNSFYVGYDGGLKLIEDIYSVAKTRFN